MAIPITDETKELAHEYLAAGDDEVSNAITALLAEDFATTYTDATDT